MGGEKDEGNAAASKASRWSHLAALCFPSPTVALSQDVFATREGPSLEGGVVPPWDVSGSENSCVQTRRTAVSVQLLFPQIRGAGTVLSLQK